MTVQQLATELQKMYACAQSREQVAMIHLFGIKYHKEIEPIGATSVVKQSGLSQRYYSEVRKGMKLAKFVELKEKYKQI